jgi:hypothetical protein
VLDAERALLRSRDQLIAAEAEAADAELALFRAIGGKPGARVPSNRTGRALLNKTLGAVKTRAVEWRACRKV